MRPNPLNDILAFAVAPGWVTPVFWLLLAGSLAAAVWAWRGDPVQRMARHVGVWLLRLTIGGMWWQQSLWKVPPDYVGLKYWMMQMTEHAAIPLLGDLVRDYALPNLWLFGPAVRITETFIGVALMIGVVTRLGALAGAAMTINLWLGLYSAPGEWPWTYGFLIIIMLIYLIDPPGRSLGIDAVLRRRGRLSPLLG